MGGGSTISVLTCPEPLANKFGVPVLLSTYLMETLVRTKQRQDLHAKVQLNELCPRCVFCPLIGDWFQPSQTTQDEDSRHASSTTFSMLVPYLETEMDLVLLQNQTDAKRTVWNLQQSWSNPYDRAQLWSLYMIYEYGGGFLGSHHELRTEADRIFWQQSSEHFENKKEGLVWEKQHQQQHQQDGDIVHNGLSFAMSPKTWELQCLWDRLAEIETDVTFAVILQFLEVVQTCKKHKQSSSSCCPQHFQVSAGWCFVHLRHGGQPTTMGCDNI